MTTKKDFLTVRNNFLQRLDNYTDEEIKNIADSYDYYADNYKNKFKLKSFLRVYDLLNEIIRTILKNNLIYIYYNGCSQNLKEYVLKVEYDELEPLYNELSDAGKKLNKRLMKSAHGKLIIRDLLSYAPLISINRMLRKLLSDSTDEIFYNFNEMFTLLEKTGMNHKEMIDATLCIVAINIYNGIYDDGLDSMEAEEIKRAHRLIESEYLSKIETKDEYDINAISLAFSILGFPNATSVNCVFEKIDRKRTDSLNEVKVVHKPIKVEEEPKISRSEYYEGMKIISQYYDLETSTVKRILKISEIQYVVTIMQNLYFSSATIEKFITKALKKHKNISALDRYLDLSQKIDYYKGELDIENLDKTLHDLVNEYITSSAQDKDFWLSSINEELENLENILNQNHNYELGIKKSQE